MLDDAALSELIDELLAGWVRFVGGSAPALSDWRGRSDAQVATVMALTAHVHSTAMILRPALPNGLTIAHMPLVRAVFEATITLVWCDEVADGAYALVNEGARQRRNLRDSLAETHSMSEMADKIQVGGDAIPTSSDQQARFIRARCDDVALDGAYAIYRMLSALSHTSIETIDAYLDEDLLRPGQSMSIKSNPGPLGSSRSWAHTVACCLLWSGMATNYLDKARTRRSELRRIARALGVTPVLPVSYSAKTRSGQ